MAENVRVIDKRKKRQKIRSAIIIILFLLFPLILNFFSPYIIIDGASNGIINGSFITFGLLFVFSLFLGRAWCGWACPAGGLQEIAFSARDKKVRGGKFDWIKYFIWVPWIGIIVFMVVKAGGYQQVDPFYLVKDNLSQSEPASNLIYYIVLYYIVVGTFLILSLAVGRRAGCHYICWMAPFMIIGNKIKNFFRLPALHLNADKGKCSSCKTCTRNCPMSLDVNGMVQRSSMVNSECIICGTCADGCAKGVISYSFSRPRGVSVNK